MAFNFARNYCSLWLLLLLLHYAVAEETAPPANSEEEDDSSSEETAEDSNESRRKRSAEASNDAENASRATTGGTSAGVSMDSPANGARAGIPGFPDPATIIKIAEIVQTVGEKVIPILVEGKPKTGVIAERLNRNFDFLNNFKRDIDSFTDELGVK